MKTQSPSANKKLITKRTGVAGMSEWQPIETIPKTGEPVLLGFFDGEVVDYKTHGDCYVQVGKRAFETAEGKIRTQMLCGAPDNNYVSLFCENSPTHWQPMPAAPCATTAA